VVLTVPASFDEGARALTLEAAQMAGLPRVQLLEEPKAAFHDWLVLQGDELAAQLADSRLVLVVDVGGGTTDLTLIRVDASADGSLPTLTRTAVGEHLMLGGDNMDLALAHQLEPRLLAKVRSSLPSALPSWCSAAAWPRSSCWRRTRQSRSASPCWGRQQAAGGDSKRHADP
jgi:molecular chaperone DnaK (HSP70)